MRLTRDTCWHPTVQWRGVFAVVSIAPRHRLERANDAGALLSYLHVQQPRMKVILKTAQTVGFVCRESHEDSVE